MGRIASIKYNCASNGEGVRTAIFLSGCNLHCPGCFNTEAWDFDNGDEVNDELINKILDSIEPSYINGLSILGGEPMDVRNQETTYRIIEAFRKRFNYNKTIWMWTGYEIDKNLPETEYTEKIKAKVDIIVDGPWKKDLFNPKLRFRGSSNQRILENGRDF